MWFRLISWGKRLRFRAQISQLVADQRVVHASVAAFINDLRMVTPDIALQRRAIFRAYAMLSNNDPSNSKSQ
jgi:type IV secretory pathway TrbF-like protein